MLCWHCTGAPLSHRVEAVGNPFFSAHFPALALASGEMKSPIELSEPSVPWNFCCLSWINLL